MYIIEFDKAEDYDIVKELIMEIQKDKIVPLSGKVDFKPSVYDLAAKEELRQNLDALDIGELSKADSSYIINEITTSSIWQHITDEVTELIAKVMNKNN